MSAAPARRTLVQQRGAASEQRALEFLVAQGCRFVARNERAKVGEIDIIVRQGQELVFVEVRSRSSAGFGGAAASVDAGKQLRLRRAAEFYLLRTYGQRAWPPCRFDVIAFESDRLNWIKNAF